MCACPWLAADEVEASEGREVRYEGTRAWLDDHGRDVSPNCQLREHRAVEGERWKIISVALVERKGA